jgi:hypothetical protein
MLAIPQLLTLFLLTFEMRGLATADSALPVVTGRSKIWAICNNTPLYSTRKK